MFFCWRLQVWFTWVAACMLSAGLTVLCACGRSTATTQWWTAGRVWAACRTDARRSEPLCSMDSCTLWEALMAAQVQLCYCKNLTKNFKICDCLRCVWYIFCVSAGLSTVEAYNAKTDEWFHVLPMSTRRSSVGVGVVNGEYNSHFGFTVSI